MQKGSENLPFGFAVSLNSQEVLSELWRRFPRTRAFLGLVWPSPSGFIHEPRDPGADNSERAREARSLPHAAATNKLLFIMYGEGMEQQQSV